MYRVYGALLALAWAAVLPCQMLMSFLQRARPLPLRERLGFLPDDVSTDGFWMHAVSVGEMRLALRILPELRRRFPGAPVHVSTGTPTGRALATAGAGGPPPESIGALPFDLPFAMGRLLDRLRPRAVLIVETEIWPNLLRLCAKRGVPVLLVNGRISSRSFPRYRALRGFVGRALPGFRTLGMQSRDDADRVISLGAPADRVVVTGNLKFDLEPPRARLVLAPRHPENFGAAERMARDAGHAVLAWSRLAERTADSPSAGAWEVLVLDRLGVLPEVYAAADLVFVGGSLVPRGGQNVLEPAAVGKPVLFGPLTDNFRAASEALVSAGAGFVARDGEELGRLLVRLLDDRAGYRVASAMARRVVETNRGALLKTMTMIEEALAPGDSMTLRAART